MWCFYHMLDVAFWKLRGRGKYIVVFLEKFRGFGCCFLALGFVSNDTCVVDGQVDPGWCSHGFVAFV